MGLIGVGQGGGSVVDRFVARNEWSSHKSVLPFAIAINTAKSDLMGLKNVPMDSRVLIGQTRVKGHGAGGNPDLGARVAEEDIHFIKRAISRHGTHNIDAFLVIAGLGGGTGSGGSSIIARALKESYSEPVYSLAILPSEDEGQLMAFNAAKSLHTLSEEVDAIFLWDNQIWQSSGLSMKDTYTEMNNRIVDPFLTLLGAGEVTSSSRVGVKVVDASDIIYSTTGYVTMGYSGWQKSSVAVVKDVGMKILPFLKKSSVQDLDPTTRCFSLIQDAANGMLSAECNYASATKAMFIVSGTPSEISRQGIDKARVWLEQVTAGAEVRGGDYPMPMSKSLSSVVMFSGLQEIEVINRITEKAKMVEKLRAKKANGSFRKKEPVSPKAWGI